MKMQIGRWGNSLAVRLPKELVDRFGLREGGEIDTAGIEAVLEAHDEATQASRRKEALRRIAERPRLPDGARLDREEMYADHVRPR